MLSDIPELAGLCVIPVWKGGLNNSVTTFGLMFTRKDSNPQDIALLINSAAQLLKMQQRVTDILTQQMLTFEAMAVKANETLKMLSEEAEARRAELATMGGSDGQT
jgi:hypothetical protein